MPKLTVIAGENKGSTHSFETEAIIGRAPDEKGFFIKDLRASRKHAQVIQAEGDFYLQDLHSQNGTYLNGHRIKSSMKLKNNDNIRIGTTWIAFVSEEESLIPGEFFLGYKITREISKEETGNIYLAVQSSLERNVMLWVLPQETLTGTSSENALAQQNFLKRISTVASLFHPNIMMLMDFAVTNRYFYCAFEELDFKANIGNYMLAHEQGVAVDDCIEIALQAAQGMLYAHNTGTVHLHLTSKNILLLPGSYNRIVLTEFGVSRFLSEMTVHSGSTTTGILGISEYIAPEQIAGSPPEGKRTDIYSYGCFLYHLLSGTPPYAGKSAVEIAKMQMKEAPKTLTDMRRDLPPQLVSIVSRCMEKNTDKRYASFAAILEDLRIIQSEREFSQVLHSDQGQALVKHYLQEKTIHRWWILLPLLATTLGILFFLLMPLLATYF